MGIKSFAAAIMESVRVLSALDAAIKEQESSQSSEETIQAVEHDGAWVITDANNPIQSELQPRGTIREGICPKTGG